MKAALFDMDGVLVDSELMYFEAAQRLLQKYNKTLVIDDVRHLSGATVDDFWWEVKELCDLDLSIQQLVEECGEIYRKDISIVKPLPGVEDFLTAIHKKLKTALVTNARRKSKDTIMNATGLAKHFDRMFTKEDHPKPKPSPEAYLFAAEQLGFSPQECVVFEDSLRGAKAAKDAGTYTVVIPRGITTQQEFSFADKVVADLSELDIEELVRL